MRNSSMEALVSAAGSLVAMSLPSNTSLSLQRQSGVTPAPPQRWNCSAPRGRRKERARPYHCWPRWLQLAALQRSHRLSGGKNLGLEGGREDFGAPVFEHPFRPMCLLQWTAEDAAPDYAVAGFGYICIVGTTYIYFFWIAIAYFFFARRPYA